MDAIFHETHELGSFQKAFLPRAVPGKVMLGSAIVCVLLGVLEVITAVNKFLAPPSTVLSDSYRQDAILIAAILSVVFFLVAAALGALCYAHKKHRVDLYEYGIVIVTWRGSTSFPWSNVDDIRVLPIYGRSRRPVNWDFTVTRDDGVKAQFRGLDGLETLARLV